MGGQSGSFGLGRRLVAVLVVAVAVVGSGGIGVARAADAPTLQLLFETRLCPSAEVAASADWFGPCHGTSDAVPAFKVSSPLGPNSGFKLPFTTYGANGQLNWHPARLAVTAEARTIAIQQVGSSPLRMRAVWCAWDDGKSWPYPFFRLPQQGLTATLDWSVPAMPEGAAPITGLDCWLLFTGVAHPSL